MKWKIPEEIIRGIYKFYTKKSINYVGSKQYGSEMFETTMS